MDRFSKPLETASRDLWTKLVAEFVRGKKRLRSSDENPEESTQRRSKDNQMIAITRDNLGNITKLWESFTVNRGEVHRYLMDPARSRSAYLLGFHLPNMVRGLKTWQRVIARQPGLKQWLKGLPKIELLDVGCGCGSSAQATILFLRDMGVAPEKIFVHGIDRNGKFLDAFRFGCGLLIPEANVRASKMDLGQFRADRITWSGEGAQLLTLGYFWNELGQMPGVAGRMRQVMEAVLRHPRGMVWLMDPANEQPARQLMELRDQLVDTGTMLYPCPHSHKCPMLASSRDWCYSEFSWQPPVVIQYIDKNLKLNRKKLSCSAFFVVNPEVAAALSGETKWQYIVVGRPTDVTKVSHKLPRRDRRFQYLVCGADGLEKRKPEGAERQLRGTWL